MEAKPDTLTAVLWPAEPVRKRGPKPSLSRQQIIETAIEVADASGLSAVTMQLLADQLGRPKMSLYRYLPGRDELVALMADAALGAPPAAAGRGWRGRLRNWALQAWPVFLAHPWLHQVTVGPRVFGPNELGWMEVALGALDATDLTGAERLDAVALLTGHLRSMAAQRSAGPRSATDASASDDIEAQSAALMAQLLTDHADRFPLTAAAFGQAQRTGTTDQALEFGLDRILDGLGALIDRRRG
ncbi:TetR/AcrR family transcriptional regulator [Nakamurella lactea]|uniref:TetR/AcrR family transcriptional regulator n=1 Tax=Nakamurella lactea TaxID=459515 RepID=UPI0004103BEB|nr:TetR/AcrR family transcriptional regulator [Nakamurella lactea]